MRILNDVEFRHALQLLLKDHHTDHESYRAWLIESVPKWLLKNSPEFRSNFLTPVKVWTSSLFQGENAPKSYYVLAVDGVTKTRLRLEGFDAKDADAGTLWYYSPQKSLAHWLWVENPILVEARDFFSYLLDKDPSQALSKYTIDTLPRHLATWRREMQAKAEQEQAERVAQMLRRAETQAARDALHEELEREKAKGFLAQQEVLKKTWSLLDAKDYKVCGQKDEWMFVQFLSPGALEWEAAFKGCCINLPRYKSALNDTFTILGSLRRASDPATSIYTVELTCQVGWSVVQFERYGYGDSIHPAELQPERQKALEAMRHILAELPKPQAKAVQEYTIHRS